MEIQEIFGKNNSFYFINVGTRQTNDIIYRMGADDLELCEFRRLWELIFGHLLKEYFAHFVKKEDENKLAVGIILRAGLSGFLAAKDFLLYKNIPVFLIQTERKENESAGNIEADMLYCNLPKDAPHDLKVIILEPMLATGVSMKQAMRHLKNHNILEKNITFLIGIAAYEGIENLFESYPDIHIIAAYSETHIGLNEANYIIYKDTGKPVAGDVGDRLMGISGKGKLMNLNNKKGGENDR